MIGDYHGNITVSEGFSVLMALLFEKILDKNCCKIALLTPILCEAKSSIVLAFLDAVCLDFRHGKRVVLYHGDSRSSQHCARHQCRRRHVAVIAKRKRRQYGLKLVLGPFEGVLHGTLNSLKISSGPHAYLETITSEMIRGAHEAVVVIHISCLCVR